MISISIPDGELEKIQASTDHSYKCSEGSVTVTVPDGYTGDYSSEAIDNSLTKDLAIEYFRGRGNSTWKLDKKPYKFKLDKKADLLGMGKDKSWVLLANRFDPTLLRNRIAMYMADKMGLEFTPKCLPVDLVINGVYQGSYSLSQNIKTGNTRIDIDKLNKDNTSGGALTGGYIIALDPWTANTPESMFRTNSSIRFMIDTPKYEVDENGEMEGNSAQKQYIKDYVQKTENAIFGEDFKDKDGIPYTDYMDIDSAINYWWLQEFTKNIDGFISPSTYLYKKRNGMLYWGPIWDMDQCIKGTTINLFEPKSNTVGFDSRPMKWLDYLRSYNTEYRNRLKSRWPVVDTLVNELTADGGVIDKMAEETRLSWQNDYLKWGGYGMLAGKSYDPVLFTKHVNYIKEWMKNRQAWINGHLSDEYLTESCHCVTFINNNNILGTRYYSHNGQFLQYPYPPAKEGYIFRGWLRESDGKIFSDTDYITEDMTLIPEYVELSEAKQAEQLFFNVTDVWAEISDRNFQPEITAIPSEYDDCTIKWTSSYPEIADVNALGDGTVYLNSTGKTTITAELMSGNKVSYDLTVYDSMETHFNKAASIVSDKDTIIMDPGETRQLNVSMEPKPCIQDVKYFVFNSEICSVGEAGNITAQKPGTTTIQYKSKSNYDLKGNITIIVNKYDNTLKVKAVPVKLKASALKKRSRTIARKNALKITAPIGKVTYSKVKVSKAKYKNKFKVNKSTGRITVSKGLKKGTYKLTISVKAGGDKEHLFSSKNVTVRIKVN